MSQMIDYLLNKATEEEIAEYLRKNDADFVPPLRGRVVIKEYAKKIATKATRFEAWFGETLVGLVAAYCNDKDKRNAYVTSVCVSKVWTGKGIAEKLMKQCLEYVKASGLCHVSLEVAIDNTPAIQLYEKCGFAASKMDTKSVNMSLCLISGK